jgi:hypothetical protein
LVGALFHSSVIILLVFPFFRRILNLNIGLFALLCIYASAFIFGHFLFDDLMGFVLSSSQYSSYLDSDYLLQDIAMINILSKIPKILIILICAYYFDRQLNLNLYQKYKFLINIGYISGLILILSLFSPLAWRFYQYFDFLTIMPLLVFLSEKKINSIFKAIIILLFFIFILKILVFAQGEYKYQSIVF